MAMAPERKRELTLDALWELYHAAAKVSYKFGTNDNDVPSVWDEWINLRRALMQTRHAMKREGRQL